MLVLVERRSAAYGNLVTRRMGRHGAHAICNLGRPAIVSLVISAVDAALWDLKARLLNLPLVTLLGAVRDGVPVYGSGGFTSYSNAELEKQLTYRNGPWRWQSR